MVDAFEDQNAAIKCRCGAGPFVNEAGLKRHMSSKKCTLNESRRRGILPANNLRAPVTLGTGRGTAYIDVATREEEKIPFVPNTPPIQETKTDFFTMIEDLHDFCGKKREIIAFSWTKKGDGTTSMALDYKEI